MIHTKRVNGRKHLALEICVSQRNFYYGGFVNKTLNYYYAVLMHFILNDSLLAMFCFQCINTNEY